MFISGLADPIQHTTLRSIVHIIECNSFNLSLLKVCMYGRLYGLYLYITFSQWTLCNDNKKVIMVRFIVRGHCPQCGNTAKALHGAGLFIGFNCKDLVLVIHFVTNCFIFYSTYRQQWSWK